MTIRATLYIYICTICILYRIISQPFSSLQFASGPVPVPAKSVTHITAQSVVVSSVHSNSIQYSVSYQTKWWSAQHIYIVPSVRCLICCCWLQSSAYFGVLFTIFDSVCHWSGLLETSFHIKEGATSQSLSQQIHYRVSCILNFNIYTTIKYHGWCDENLLHRSRLRGWTNVQRDGLQVPQHPGHSCGQERGAHRSMEFGQIAHLRGM